MKLTKLTKITKAPEENTFIPLRATMLPILQFWRGTTLRGEIREREGNFNVALYLDYLEIIKNPNI
jgi:hypothetical protein